MKEIFKSAIGTPKKVSDTNFEKHYPSVNMNMEWKQLAPYIKQATKTYIIPFIGIEMYNDLADAYQAQTNDANQLEAIDLLQDAVAYYAIYHSMPKLNTVIAERGIQEQNDSKGTSRSVSMWRFKNTRWDVMMDADKYLDQLLSFMEKMIVDEDAFFDPFKNSEAYKKGRSDFFSGTTDLNDFLKINNSRKTFLSLVPYLRKVEKLHLKSILCDAQYDDIQSPDGPHEEHLYYLCKNYVAWKALEMAIPELRVNLDGDGIQFVMTTDGMNITKEAYETGVAAYQHSAINTARRAAADLMYFLQSNEEEFPLWADSDCRPKDKEIGNFTHKGAVSF